MMVDERETRNGHGCDLNCSMGPTTEETENGEGGLLLDGSSGGASFGEGTCAESSRIIYKRRKRRKMSSSDEKTITEFNDKIKAGDADHDVTRLIFDDGPDKCSLRHCGKMVLQQMQMHNQSRNGHENGVGECMIRTSVITFPESDCAPPPPAAAIKECVDNVERNDNYQTQNSAKQHPLVISSRLLNQSEGPPPPPTTTTNSKLCELACSDILMSDNFSELCGLLAKNFGVVDVHQILDLDAIKTKIKNGDYETSPMLYHNDIRQVWTKLEKVGNEIVTLANSLSDESRARCEQATEARGTRASKCHGCGGTAHPQNCLVCDSCEEIYHVSCTDLLGPEMPPKTWHCGRCISNGMGSPHDDCIVCEKLKSTASLVLVGVSRGGIVPPPPPPSSKTCFVCKSEVNPWDDFRTCGHSLCAHKFYHCKCLTNRQLGVCGPCWYCPSCLCRRCMIDKDDHHIVLCDGCDQAYHIYCTTPQLPSIPTGRWFCGKCDRELKRINTMKRLYENMQTKVKVEVEEEQQQEQEGGLEMLVTAAKTLSHQETMDR